MAGQSRGAPIKGGYNPTGEFPWQLLFYFNVDKRCLCLSWKAVAERITYIDEMSIAAVERIYFSDKLTSEELYE